MSESRKPVRATSKFAHLSTAELIRYIDAALTHLEWELLLAEENSDG
jgi:hypothetical protein